MTTDWRPPEWEKMVVENLEWKDRESVEAGANLILKALREKATLKTKDGMLIVLIPAEPGE